MVKRVIHVADLHIPNEENEKRPYRNMLNNFCVEIRNEVRRGNMDAKDVRIVLCGDSYVSKIKISNEAMIMFHRVLNYLNNLARTFVIAGNHDMLENNDMRMDSITPTFEINDVYPNITYLDKLFEYKSGCLVDDNIIWALYSAFSKFDRPDIDTVKKFNPECNRVIGLYHGDLVGSKTDTGYTSQAGIDTKNFSGCDAVMCGHIHKYQTINKNGIPLVYSSSVFQQNIGENVNGHGFVIWNIEDMSYELHEVPNIQRRFHFKIGSYDDVKNNQEKVLNFV